MAFIGESYLTYGIPGFLTREKVAATIARIEEVGSVLRDRSETSSTQILFQVSLPVTYSLPSGVVQAPSNLDIIVDYAPGAWTAPTLGPLIELSKFGEVSLLVELAKDKQEFRCWLGLDNGVFTIEIEVPDVEGLEESMRIECLRTISDLLQLPLVFSQPGLATSTREGLEVTVKGLEPTQVSIVMTCHLSQSAFQEVFERLLAKAKRKLSSWRVKDNRGVVPFTDLVAKVNAVGLPSRKTEISHWWRLRSYQDFPVMMEMAARSCYEDAGQSLFDFEFGDGKPARLSALAKNKRGFKLHFRFNSKDDQAEFTRASRIKLDGPT